MCEPATALRARSPSLTVLARWGSRQHDARRRRQPRVHHPGSTRPVSLKARAVSVGAVIEAVAELRSARDGRAAAGRAHEHGTTRSAARMATHVVRTRGKETRSARDRPRERAPHLDRGCRDGRLRVRPLSRGAPELPALGARVPRGRDVEPPRPCAAATASTASQAGAPPVHLARARFSETSRMFEIQRCHPRLVLDNVFRLPDPRPRASRPQPEATECATRSALRRHVGPVQQRPARGPLRR